jgi:hypothetical protein
MLTGVRHKSMAVAIVSIFILNIPFANEKCISVSALSSKIKKAMTLTIGDADLTIPSYL